MKITAMWLLLTFNPQKKKAHINKDYKMKNNNISFVPLLCIVSLESHKITLSFVYIHTLYKYTTLCFRNIEKYILNKTVIHE